MLEDIAVLADGQVIAEGAAPSPSLASPLLPERLPALFQWDNEIAVDGASVYFTRSAGTLTRSLVEVPSSGGPLKTTGMSGLSSESAARTAACGGTSWWKTIVRTRGASGGRHLVDTLHYLVRLSRTQIEPAADTAQINLLLTIETRLKNRGFVSHRLHAEPLHKRSRPWPSTAPAVPSIATEMSTRPPGLIRESKAVPFH